MIRLFAVVVTWNGEDCIAKRLYSLLNASIPMQIVVVDNASSDQTVEIVQAICPDAIIFQLTQNRGFGKANNIGIKYAYEHGAEHVLLINQDAYVDANTPKTRVALQQANPESAILSPLHLDATGRHLDRLFANHIGETASIRELMSDALLKREIADIYHVDFINAAIWLLSRDCVTHIGLFNPTFDHYREDDEYVDRVRYKGFNVSLATTCYAYHQRTQDPTPDNLSTARHLLKANAEVQYRISRKTASTWFNITSTIFCIMFFRPSSSTSFVRSIEMRLRLLHKLFSILPTALRCRNRTYNETKCFFDDTGLDSQRYIVND